jgi:hypothetical protein
MPAPALLADNPLWSARRLLGQTAETSVLLTSAFIYDRMDGCMTPTKALHRNSITLAASGRARVISPALDCWQQGAPHRVTFGMIDDRSPPLGERALVLGRYGVQTLPSG